MKLTYLQAQYVTTAYDCVTMDFVRLELCNFRDCEGPTTFRAWNHHGTYLGLRAESELQRITL